MRGSGRPPVARRVLAVAVIVVAAACSGSDGGSDAGGARDVPATAALTGPHRYEVTHENLGSCTGAAEDGEEILELTFTAEGLTLANLDFDWTQDFVAVATGRYERTEETSEGSEWRKTLTVSTEGFVVLSETNDPVQVGQGAGLQPCLRYTYRLLD